MSPLLLSRAVVVGAAVNWLAPYIVDERGQDTFEWLLIIGAITVAVLLAVTTPLGNAVIGQVITGVCLGLKTLLPTTACP
jgi:hypothetical protein